MRSSSGFATPSSSVRQAAVQRCSRRGRRRVGVEAAVEQVRPGCARLRDARPAPPPRFPARRGSRPASASGTSPAAASIRFQSMPGAQHQAVEAVGLRRAVQQRVAARRPGLVEALLRAVGAGLQPIDVQHDLRGASAGVSRCGTSSMARRSRLSNSGSASASASGAPGLASRSVSARGPAPGGREQVGARPADRDRAFGQLDVRHALRAGLGLAIGGREGRRASAPARAAASASPRSAASASSSRSREAARGLGDGGFQRGVVHRRAPRPAWCR